MKIYQFNGETNEAIYRDPTPEELAQAIIDSERVAAKAKAEAEAAAKREAALSKLAALGLTPDDLTALGL